MRVDVHPSQLIPQCVITNDVFGMTNRPIVPKDTIINEIHIEVLRRFLIDKVEVAPKLASGAPYHPQERKQERIKEQKNNVHQPIIEHYYDTVRAYEGLFQNWQSGSPVQIQKVRELIVPLLERIEEFETTLSALHHFSNEKDYFYHHSVATSLLAAGLAKRLGIKKEWMQVGIAAFLAESGIAKVDRRILQKNGLFTAAEFNEIKKHPTFSYRHVEKIPALSQGAKLAILQHHERADGTGYPLGIKADQIHPFAKIIAICDTYHAMTVDRHYQKRQDPFSVMEQMEQDRYQKFDHQMLTKFMEMMTTFPLGTKVLLSNQAIAEIVYIEPNNPTRPIVRLENEEMLMLKEHKSIHIQEIIR